MKPLIEFIFLLKISYKIVSCFIEITDCFFMAEKTKENKAFSKPLKNIKCQTTSCFDKSTG